MAAAELAAEVVEDKLKTKIILLILIVLLAISGCSKKSDIPDSFAQCLTEKGAVMYGTYWCSYCNAQKRDFGDSFEFVNYVECTEEKNRCIEDGIEGFPTWIINGIKYEGKQRLSKLSDLTGCELPLTQ